MCKLLDCVDVCDLIHRMCRVIAEVGEIVKSCSIAVIENVSVLNSIFKYQCIVYKSFYTGMLWF